MAEQKQAIQQGAKKSFFEVKAPATATKIALYAESAEELEGKTVKIDLTRHLRGKSLQLTLRVKKQEEGLVAEPFSAVLVGSYIRRMIRKGTDYVEDSFVTECKDAKVVIKPFFITRKRVSREVRKMLRNRAREHLIVHCTTRTMKELLSEILANKIQRELALVLKKIYPLALCEIRVFEVAEEKK